MDKIYIEKRNYSKYGRDNGYNRDSRYRSHIRYITKKVMQMLAVLLLLSIVVFVIARLCPGDPLRSYYGDGVEHMSEIQKEAARDRLGLNDSMMTQYFRWIGGVFDGELGMSYKYKATRRRNHRKGVDEYADSGRNSLCADLWTGCVVGHVLRTSGRKYG